MSERARARAPLRRLDRIARGPAGRRLASCVAAAVAGLVALAASAAAEPPGGSDGAAHLEALLDRLDATPVRTSTAPEPAPGVASRTRVDAASGQVIVFETGPSLVASAERTWPSESGAFSLPLGPPGVTGRRGLPDVGGSGSWAGWRNLQGIDRGFDIKIERMPDGSWIRGRVEDLSRFGVEGALRAEQAYAEELVEAEPDRTLTDVSLETYRASALRCGHLRGSPATKACSVAHVAVHDGRTIRLHALIVGRDRATRQAIVEEVVEVLEGLTVHPPG